MVHKILSSVSLALLLAFAPFPAGAEEALVLDKTSGCRLVPFRNWAGADVQWVGPCDKEVANGLGALKRYSGGALEETFYGELKNGAPIVGVVDKGPGYEAGRVEAGILQDSSDRQENVEAFKIATKAARAVSERFRKAGNAKSATHYRSIAKQLSDALD